MLFTFLVTGRISICASIVFKCEKKKGCTSDNLFLEEAIYCYQAIII